MISKLIERADHGGIWIYKRMPEYYDAIVNWLKTRHDLEVNRENIEYAPGVVFALNMMIRLFTEKGGIR